MATLRDLFIGNPSWNRPTPGANRCVILAGSACCICVPDTATRVVVEMWGQGGGGAPGRCCSWSCTGGQGGSYASKVWEGSSAPVTTGQPMRFCGCVCACDCMTFCSMCGHNGQFSRLTNCNTLGGAGIGSWVGCVAGGCGGQCRQDATSYVCSGCGVNYNTGYDTDCISAASPLPEYYSISNCMSTAQNGSCNGGSMSCCAGSACYCATQYCSSTCAGFAHRSNEVCVDTSLSAGSSLYKTIDQIFEARTCTCFDVYKLGACGWSKGTPLIGYNGTWNFCDWGVGGAAYAGGRQQKNNFSMGNFSYCGWAGNLPGGGGKSSAACGGGCCCGTIGGPGLILVSWNT